MKYIGLSGLLLAAVAAFSITTAQAQPMMDRAVAATSGGVNVETVQWLRGGQGGYRGG